MDEDQFDAFVQYACMHLSRNEPYLSLTAAQGRARGYFEVDRPRGDQDFLGRLLGESPRDKSSWDAVNMIAQDLIRDGETLPPKLAEWTVDVLADQLAKRGQERRPRPSKGGRATAGRDWHICYLIDRMNEKWNLTPTRNDISTTDSACDVLAVATDLPYGTIARIWNSRSHLLHKAGICAPDNSESPYRHSNHLGAAK